MSKRLNAKKKVSRVFGVNLWGKTNDPSLKRNYRPGQHGTGLKRDTTYGIQLKAKQKLKKYYGNIGEKQFSNLFFEAKRLKGDTAENFVGLLERRLDIIVYRANFVPTVFASRQFINHKHVLVNGKVVNIPSYLVKVGDVIEIKESAKNIPMVVDSIEKMEREVPNYLEVNTSVKSVKFLNVPKLEEIPYATQMDLNAVVEFYSK